jgi:hypothetical protein
MHYVRPVAVSNPQSPNVLRSMGGKRHLPLLLYISADIVRSEQQKDHAEPRVGG